MTFDEQLSIAIRLGVAALGGMAVGIEREWSGRKEGEAHRFAGVRTFLLIGLLGSLSMLLVTLGAGSIGLLILSGSILLIVAAYISSTIHGNRDSTTEFSAVVVLGAGVMSGLGHLAIASAINAFVALVLVEKSRIHSFVFHIESEDLTAGLRFAVLALVVLPLLPPGPFGPPPGIKPRELWSLVLLFSGLSFLGLLARRAAGPKKGYFIAGLLGGLISSTLVTLNFSRESRTDDSIGRALAVGVIAACSVLAVRVIVLTAVMNPKLAWALLPYLSVAFVVGLVFMLLLPKKETGPVKEIKSPENPLRLLPAIQMVLAFQAALYVFRWVQTVFGSKGVLVTSALAGLTDVDTLTFMIAKQTNLDLSLAVTALVIGVISNTVLKLALTCFIGRKSFRVVASAGLLLICVALVISLAFV